MRTYCINLTPHDVNVYDDNGRLKKTYKASGMVARASNDYKVVEDINGTPLVVRNDDNIIGLPEPKEGVTYIVSNIILNHCPDRKDIIAPACQVKVNGIIVGCRAFVGNR